MGNKTSKQEGFSRTLSIRKSQKTTFQKINKKLERISKDIEKFNGNINDEKYTKIKQNVNEIIVDLEKISANVKDKHKDVYENILDKCNEQLNKLDAKVPSFTGVINAENAPPAVDSSLSQCSLVELKLVKIAVEDKKKVTIEETPSVSSVELPTEEKLQNNTVDRIDTMRKQIEYLEGEIHIYKQDNDQKLYGYIKENLNQIIIKLDNMETYGNVQIKHERKLALQRAQDCLRYLNSDPVPNKPNNQTEVDVEMHEDHARKITYTRPITFDLNTNEELKDELMQILNKRMEEASKEQSNGDEDTKPNPTKGPDDFENVENSETEEEFDFVDIADDSKSVPMLVTSL